MIKKALKGLFALLFLGWIQEVVAELKLPDTVSAPTVDVQVDEGGSVFVTLSIVDREKKGFFDRETRDFDFVITAPPRNGELFDLRQLSKGLDRDSASVRYVHHAHSLGDSDSFSFEARLQQGNTTVAGLALIHITRSKIKTTVPVLITLGPIAIGDTIEQSVTLENVGKGIWRGPINLESPFRLKENLIEIKPGKSQPITITFQPADQGVFKQKVVIPSHEDGGIQIMGIATSPFQLETQQLDFGQIANNQFQEKSIQVFSRSNRKIELNAKVLSPFHLSKNRILLRPRSSESLIVELNSSQTGRLTSELYLTGAGVTVTGQVTVLLLTAPSLEVVNIENLNFGTNLLANYPQTNTFILNNRGEMDWAGRVEVGNPFWVNTHVLHLPSFRTGLIQVVFSPVSTGWFQQPIRFMGSTSNQYEVTGSVISRLESIHEPVGQKEFSEDRSFIHQSDSNIIQKSTQQRVLPQFESKKMIQQQVAFYLEGVKTSFLSPEEAIIRWPASTDQSTNDYIIYQQRFLPIQGKTRADFLWQQLDDVTCQKDSLNHFYFKIDRLRPAWSYTFAIGRLNTMGYPELSQPITVYTPLPQIPFFFKYWRFLAIGLLIGIFGFYWLKTRVFNSKYYIGH